MSSIRRAGAALVVAVAALGSLASAPVTSDDCRHTSAGEEICSLRTYFTCSDDLIKLNNAGVAVAGIAGWSTTPPGAVGDGAGCATADPGVLIGTAADPVFAGTYDGRLQDMTVEMFTADPGFATVTNAISDPEIEVEISLLIDGVTYFDQARTTARVELDDTGTIGRYEIGIAFLPLAGPGDAGTHDIRLTVRSYYSDALMVHGFGAAEFPAGVEFNPEVPAPNLIGAFG